ncbi:DUF4255 domain-containing protein [Actinoplanes sp. NPDC000266]
MSNYLAAATVTEALRQFFFRTMTDFPVGFTVSARKPPPDPPTDPTIGIFLYKVQPNGALRGQDAPTRATDGTLLKRPQAALDLHYLISFYGDESELIAQRLMGAAVRSLHEEPVLSPADIAEAALQPHLAGTDLGAAPQRVRFTPTQLDVDDLSRLWQMLAGSSFALSVMYQATAVLLDGRATPAAGLPVLRRRIHVEPFSRPAVERVLSAVPGGPADDGPVTADRELVLAGHGLARPGMTAEVGGLAAPVLRVTESGVFVGQPGELPPGVQPVHLSYGPGLESNAVSYVRRPRIVEAAHDDGRVRVRLDMGVRTGQRVVLLLDEHQPSGRGRGYQFTAPPANGDEHTVPVEGVRAGTYVIRVQVDGAQSPIEVTEHEISGPVVTVPA